MISASRRISRIFSKAFSASWRMGFRRRQIEFSGAPDNSERMARYLYSKSPFGGNRVKKSGFMPMKNESGVLETSIFRVSRLNRSQIKELASTAREQPPKAVGIVLAGHITRRVLTIDPNNKPTRHANIVSWPTAKEDQIELAQELANHSVLSKY